MKEHRLFIINILIFVLIIYCFCILQISQTFLFRSSSLNQIPSAFGWFPIIIYFSLYRPAFEGFLSIYFLLFSISHLSIEPFGLLLIPACLVFTICQTMKTRVFLYGPTNFILMNLLSFAIFSISRIIFQLLGDGFFPMGLDLLDYPFIALLTALISYPQYFIFQWVDRITQKPIVTASGENEI